VKLRLIKPGMSPSGEKRERPPVEVPILDTIRSWVREFQSTRADKDRLDFDRINNTEKT